MAPLKLNEDASGRMVLQSSTSYRVKSLIEALVFLGLAIIFSSSYYRDNRASVVDVVVTILGVAYFVGRPLWAALVTNQVDIDKQSRAVTASWLLFGVSLRTTTASFHEIASVDYQYYRLGHGIGARDRWRVSLITLHNWTIRLDWGEERDEMATLAQKVAAVTGAELVDNSARKPSLFEQMFDRRGGEPEARKPANRGIDLQDAAPSTPDTQTPQMAAIPSVMPEKQSPLPATEMQTAMPIETPAIVGEVVNREFGSITTQELEECIKNDAMDGQARQVLARRYHAGGKLDRAVALYQEALHIDPMDVDAQNDLGVALEQQRKRTEVEAAYRRAVALDPFSSTAHLNLGLLLRGMNRASEASQEFHQARQNARSDAESRAAEAASTGGKLEPKLSEIVE